MVAVPLAGVEEILAKDVGRHSCEVGIVAIDVDIDRRVGPVLIPSPAIDVATGRDVVIALPDRMQRRRDRRRVRAAHQLVRPLVLVAIAAGAEKRRARLVALVIRLIAVGVVPCSPQWIGHGLARLVRDKFLLDLRRRPARDLAEIATRIGLDGVFHYVGTALVVTVIGAILVHGDHPAARVGPIRA